LQLQIKARKKSAYKLPLFHKTKGVVYPPSLNLEQSSSEATARFKKTHYFEVDHLGEKILRPHRRLRCRLVVPFLLVPYSDFSEPRQNLLEITRQNHELLGAGNIHYHDKSALDFMSYSGKHYDLIYVDPSRRTGSNKKGLPVFRL